MAALKLTMLLLVVGIIVALSEAEKGPQGVKGNQGRQQQNRGPQGIVGRPGQQGPKGSQGQGYSGFQANRGPQGNRSPPASQGLGGPRRHKRSMDHQDGDGGEDFIGSAFESSFSRPRRIRVMPGYLH